MAAYARWYNSYREIVDDLKHKASSTTEPLTIICRSTALSTMIGYQLADDENEDALVSPQVNVTTLNKWIVGLWTVYGSGHKLATDITRSNYLAKAIATFSGEERECLERTGMKRFLLSACKNGSAAPSINRENDSRASQTIMSAIETYFDLISRDNITELGPAIEYLLQCREIRIPNSALVGYSDFNSRELGLLNSLSQSHDITLYMVGKNNAHVSAYPQFTIDLLSAAAQQIDEPPKGIGARVSLAQSLFVGDQQSIERDKTVDFVGAMGREAFVASIVREIATLTSKRPNWRVACALLDTTSLLPAVIREFERCGIAYEIDTQVKLSATIFGSIVLTLLRVHRGCEDASMLSRYVNSPFCSLVSSQKMNIDAGLRRMAPSKRKSGYKAFSQVLKLLASQATDSDSVLGYMSKKDIEWSIHKWLRVIDLMVNGANTQKNKSHYEGLMLNATQAAIGKTLEQLAEIYGDQISAKDLLEALQEVEVSLTSTPGSSSVLICQPSRLRGLLYEAVVFADPSNKENAIQDDITAVTRMKIEVGMTPYTSLDDYSISNLIKLKEHFLCYESLISAQQKIVFIAQLSTRSDETMIPSVLFDEVIALMNVQGQKYSDKIIALAGEKLVSIEDEVTIDSVAGLPTSPMIALRTVHTNPHCHAGNKRNTLELGEVFSPTEIETYAKCPFSWYILKLLDVHEMDFTLDQRDSGSMIHTILKAFFEKWNRPIHQSDVGSIRVELLKILESMLNEVDPPFGSDAFELQKIALEDPLMYTIIRNTLRSYPEFEMKLVKRYPYPPMPTLLEYKIDKDNPLTVGGVSIVGSIDRVDVSGEYYTVIDYKGSGVSLAGKNKQQIERKNIQTLIYLIALHNASKIGTLEALRGKESLGAFYHSYSEAKVFGCYDSEVHIMDSYDKANRLESRTEYCEALDDVEGIVSDCVLNMRAGNISISLLPPPEKNSCKYCPFYSCPHKTEVRSFDVE